LKTMLLADKPDPKSPGKVLVLRADFPNQEIRAEAKTDGHLKMKILGGWETIEVPEFGARVTVPVPHNVVPSIPLLSDAPYPIDLRKRQALPTHISIVPADGKRIPTHIVIDPGEPVWDAVGYLLPFTVKILTLTKAEAEQRTAVTEAILSRESQPPIELGKVEILLAGIVFGRNNELVKAVRNTYLTLNKAQRDFVNETERVAQNVSDTASEAWKDSTRELKRARKNIAKQVGRSSTDAIGFGAKAVGGVAKTFNKAGSYISKRLR
jgi:hypothetical protein